MKVFYMNHHQNITRIKAVYNALGPLKNNVVFVGGATVSLYAEYENGIPEDLVRPTDDVDILIELWAYHDYAKMEEQLRSFGFKNDIESGVICRYIIHGITVDVMATGEGILGFGNRWYPDGFKKSIQRFLDDQHTIRIFSAPYFVAAKLEAFKSPTRKDNNDGRVSQDFEDIMFLFEHRQSIWQEMSDCDMSLKTYLQEAFTSLLENPAFEEWVDGHAGFGYPPATYMIISRLREFIVAT